MAGFPRSARLTVRALRGDHGLAWHRVVAAGGRIALPGEEGREQRLRLEVEGVKFRGGRVRMDRHAWPWEHAPRGRRRSRTRAAAAGRETGRRPHRATPESDP